MKRHLLPLLIILLPLAAVALWVWTPRTVSPEHASELYRQYESNPYLTVAYIEDFRLNDTLTLPVTTIHALDTVTWHWLRSQFGFEESVFGSMEKNSIFFRRAPKGNYDQPADLSNMLNNDRILGYGYDRTIEVFHITDTIQYNLLSEYIYKKISH